MTRKFVHFLSLHLYYFHHVKHLKIQSYHLLAECGSDPQTSVNGKIRHSLHMGYKWNAKYVIGQFVYINNIYLMLSQTKYCSPHLAFVQTVILRGIFMAMCQEEPLPFPCAHIHNAFPEYSVVSFYHSP